MATPWTVPRVRSRDLSPGGRRRSLFPVELARRHSPLRTPNDFRTTGGSSHRQNASPGCARDRSSEFFQPVAGRPKEFSLVPSGRPSRLRRRSRLCSRVRSPLGSQPSVERRERRIDALGDRVDGSRRGDRFPWLCFVAAQETPRILAGTSHCRGSLRGVASHAGRVHFPPRPDWQRHGLLPVRRHLHAHPRACRSHRAPFRMEHRSALAPEPSGSPGNATRLSLPTHSDGRGIRRDAGDRGTRNDGSGGRDL